MIDLNVPAETTNEFTESSGGSVKDILKDFVKTLSTPDGGNLPTNKIHRRAVQGSTAAERISTGAKKGKAMLDSTTLDRSSIISKVRRSVMQFPLYITQSNRIAEAHIIGKTFEKVYASFVQNVMAQNPIITDTGKVNNLKFLQDYHTNMKESAVVTLQEFQSIFNEYCTPIDQFDEILTEAVINELRLPGGTVTFLVARPNNLLAKESARLAHEPLEGFHYLTEAPVGGPTRNTTINKSKNEGSKGSEFVLTDEILERNVDAHLKNLGLKRVTDPNATDRSDDVDLIKKTIYSKGNIRTKSNDTYECRLIKGEVTKDADGTVINREPDTYEFVMRRRDRQMVTSTQVVRSDAMRSAVDAPTMIRDTDIRKFNSLAPFQFVVKFRVDPVYDTKEVNGEKIEVLRDGTNYEQSYILGVKTVMHIIKTKDLAEDIREIISGDRKNLQKVRYKTGEISWLKDYVLNLPSLKSDAMKRLDDRRWLSTLKRLGEYSKVNGTILDRPANAINESGVPIPNATMVLTRGDIERIKDDTGIDLEKISTARTLAKRLYLIGIVIVDQTAGSFKVFFPDMDNDWDVQSLGALDAEIAKIDNSPLMAEINRISRKG